MNPHRSGLIVCLFGLGCLAAAFVSGCSLFPEARTVSPPDGGFTFTAPAGYTTREFESYVDKGMEAEYFVFAQKKPIYFQIFRKDKPADASLDMLIGKRIEKAEPEGSHYLFISRNEVQVSGKRAVAYVFAHFQGEPYVRTRETWIDAGGQVYILACSQTISADAAAQPVSEVCDRLVEGFSME